MWFSLDLKCLPSCYGFMVVIQSLPWCSVLILEPALVFSDPLNGGTVVFHGIIPFSILLMLAVHGEKARDEPQQQLCENQTTSDQKSCFSQGWQRR